MKILGLKIVKLWTSDPSGDGPRLLIWYTNTVGSSPTWFTKLWPVGRMANARDCNPRLSRFDSEAGLQMLEHRVELRVKEGEIGALEISTWLEDTVGIRGKDWEATMGYTLDHLLYAGIYVFVFTKEEDKINFMLKWY